MDPATATLIAGGAQSGSAIASQLIGGYQGRKSAKRAAKYARWNTAWAERNVPSLRMQGLRAAGLNPILAAGGSSTMAPGAAGPIGSPGQGVDLSSTSAKGAQAALNREQINLTKEQRQTSRKLGDLYEKQAGKAHWEALSSSVQAYKDELLSRAYDSPMVQRVAPYMRAFSESGLRPDLVFGTLGTSASSVAKVLMNAAKGKKMPIGFGNP